MKTCENPLGHCLFLAGFVKDRINDQPRPLPIEILTEVFWDGEFVNVALACIHVFA